VLEVRGRFKLHLNEDPYPHWSFSFLQEPVMNFEVESQFQGRPLPQITSLIINQVVEENIQDSEKAAVEEI
jgi:hypothetical protein